MGGWEEFGDLDGYLRSIDTMCKLITVRTFRRAQGALLSALWGPEGEEVQSGDICVYVSLIQSDRHIYPLQKDS